MTPRTPRRSTVVPAAAPARPVHTLAEFCAIAGLGDEAKALIPEPPAPRAFVEALVAAEHFADAVRFLAHVLPKREAIWWAWVCARGASGDAPPPAIQAALAATEAWITQPTEEHRRAAMTAAEAADFGTPAGCAALAVFFSGGSLAPPDAPVVPPGEYLAARAITGSIILSAVVTEPEKATEKFRSFVARGMDVAKRIHLWGKP